MMIAACPKCGARYRIENARLRPEGSRLRCSRCRAIFRVRPREVAQEAKPAAAPPEERRPAPSSDAPLVVVADADGEAGKATAAALAEWGLRSELVGDGVEAILTIQRLLPRAVVLDAMLPKMDGFQICELMKRNESLRHILVVLVGAIHHRERYRRPPGDLYGADAYLERPQLPEALRPILRSLVHAPRGETVARAEAPPETGSRGERAPAPTPPAAPPPVEVRQPAPRASDAAPSAARPPSEARARAATPSVSTGPSAAGETPGERAIAEAERLARVIVSDVVLYNQEKFGDAVNAGNVVEAMEGVMAEGRAHFCQRIDAQVREKRDFLAEELLRVARTRGGA